MGWLPAKKGTKGVTGSIRHEEKGKTEKQMVVPRERAG